MTTETTPSEVIEWHEIKGEWIGTIGQRIVCTISQMDDMPCETWAIMPLPGAFLSVDAAKTSAQESFAQQTSKPTQRNPLVQSLLPVFRKMLGALEDLETSERETTKAAGETS